MSDYPFAGLLVVDFGIGAVGVEVTRLFAEYGADVIKIESHEKPDFMRQLTPNLINPSFASSSRCKRSLGVNLKTERGRELVHALLRKADMVVDNLAPGVMARLEMDAATLHALNPKLIVVTSQSVGTSGPWKGWSGYGPSTHPTSGLHWLWNHADAQEPAGSVCTYPDHLVGRLGAIAGIASLIQRERTGAGATADIAQFETPIQFLGDIFAQEALEPGSAQPQGNRSERGAPWGAYPCAGDDEWVAICVRDDADWAALRDALGDPEWAADPGYASAEGRRTAHDAIDAKLASWTQELSPQNARDALQAVGVPAGELQHTEHMIADRNLAAREFIRVLDQPSLTTLLFEGPFYHATQLPEPLLEPAPLLAQHTREICREHMGLADAEIDTLVAEGVLEEYRGEDDA
ncbi:MAG: CoA transferase [Deltaproteobacteria bacterium]|nr:CoA transferase [Deltaproteobacteria bacterium]MBW2360635.1 CoA transferase [Deltaproteobacteria bacterium]